MKKLLLFCTLFLSLIGYAQGLKDLDKTFGINKFKLKSLYSLYQKDLKYFDTTPQGVEFYIYTKEDIKVIFGQTIEQISLGYINNKLYVVTINFGSITKKEDLALLENLKTLYDIPEIIEPEKDDLIYVAKWETGKIYMQAEKYTCSKQIAPCETQIFIYSKELKKELY